MPTVPSWQIIVASDVLHSHPTIFFASNFHPKTPKWATKPSVRPNKAESRIGHSLRQTLPVGLPKPRWNKGDRKRTNQGIRNVMLITTTSAALEVIMDIYGDRHSCGARLRKRAVCCKIVIDNPEPRSGSTWASVLLSNQFSIKCCRAMDAISLQGQGDTRVKDQALFSLAFRTAACKVLSLKLKLFVASPRSVWESWGRQQRTSRVRPYNALLIKRCKYFL